jgi:uncharacterized OB-fold protein
MDPTTAPFWEGAAQRRLLIQTCLTCGEHQFYPRPHCLRCLSRSLGWSEAAGTGTIYSITTVRRQATEEHVPPYQVAIVQLDEGPRFLTSLAGPAAHIGDRVRVTWRERAGAPPLPVFERTEPLDGGPSGLP